MIQPPPIRENRKPRSRDSGAPELPRTIDELGAVRGLVAGRRDIRAISFDLFDTLVEWHSSLDERHASMWTEASRELARHGICVTSEIFREVRNSLWHESRNVRYAEGHEMDAQGTLRRIVQTLAGRCGVMLEEGVAFGLAERIETAFIKIDAETIGPMKGAYETLAGLKSAGIPVVVVSNHPYRQASVELILRKCGLRDLVREVVVSSTTGFRKSLHDPQQTIFRVAAAALGMAPRFILHVGNEWEADFEAPRKLGMHAVVCDNRASLGKRHAGLAGGSARSYAEASTEAFRDCSNERCLEYYNRNRKKGSGNHEDAVVRLHEIGRDIYAPILIAFAEQNLDWLAAHPGAANVCVGRDALAVWLVQRKLIELFPERWAGLEPTDVCYLHVSRQLMLESSREHLHSLFESHGLADGRFLNIIDNGIVGTIQNCVHALYPGKSIVGHYLLARRLRSDPHRDGKEGFLVQTDSIIDGGVIIDLAITGGMAGAGLARTFLSAEFVHHHEDFWNGIYESAAPLTICDGRILPANFGAKMTETPGEKNAFGGGLGPGDYILLKKIALRAIVEGVFLYRRQVRLGISYRAQEAIGHYAQWFHDANRSEQGDGRLIKGLARVVARAIGGAQAWRPAGNYDFARY